MPLRKYDSTIARIAGNIASRVGTNSPAADADVARRCVALARAIVAEVERTEPTPDAEGK